MECWKLNPSLPLIPHTRFIAQHQAKRVADELPG